MSIVIAYFISDPAGRGIAHKIAEYIGCTSAEPNNIDVAYLSEAYVCKGRGIYILGFGLDVIYLEVLESLSSRTKYFIILSRHSARSGKPSFTTHPPGNPWGKNDAGGAPWEMPPSNPVLMWNALNELNKHVVERSISGYDVCYEVTHHGPTSITKPVTFIELGSGDNEWNDATAQKVLALATIKAIEKTESNTNGCVVSVGFGGSHYAPLFTRRALEENECYGHMIPNYVIRELDKDSLAAVARKAIELTPNARRIVIEKMRYELRKIIEDVASVYDLEVIRY